MRSCDTLVDNSLSYSLINIRCFIKYKKTIDFLISNLIKSKVGCVSDLLINEQHYLTHFIG